MLRIITIDAAGEQLPALIVPVCEDRPLHTNPTLRAFVDEGLGHTEFRGKKGQEILLYPRQGGRAERVILLGVGKGAALEAEVLRQAVGRGVKRCIQARSVPRGRGRARPRATGLAAATLVTAVGEAALLANDLFDRFKQEKDTRPLTRIDLLAGGDVARATQKLPGGIETVCRAVLTARGWVNLPSTKSRPRPSRA